jgi:hypothetical protein
VKCHRQHCVSASPTRVAQDIAGAANSRVPTTPARPGALLALLEEAVLQLDLAYGWVWLDGPLMMPVAAARTGLARREP